MIAPVAVLFVLMFAERGAVSHALLAAGRSQPTVSQQIGIDAAVARYGDDTPTGRGVVIGHVESLAGGGYQPNADARRFEGVHFRMLSGESKVSGHANGTATVIYGRGGLAPGVTDVDCYASHHWLGAGCLRAGMPFAPDPGRARVQTHSWVGRRPGDNARHTLRRLDALVDEHDVIVVVGVDNNPSRPVPELLASAHNVISVGRIDRNSSGGVTRVEGAGRSKPELVGPARLTSTTTPIVAAVAARLVDAADQQDDTAATQSEVIKAVMLAGAMRDADWQPAEGRTLDDRTGAGLVRFDRALDMLLAGQPARDEQAAVGWAFKRMGKGRSHHVSFTLDEPSELSAAATWHRRIDGRLVENFLPGQTVYLDTPRRADFDLRLLRVTDDGETVVAESASRVENVELVFERELPPGAYRLEVVRRDDSREPWDVAVAWRAAGAAER